MGLARFLDIKVTTRQSSLKGGAPIELTVHAENKSDQNLLAYPVQSIYGSVKLWVYDENGRLLPKTRFADEAGVVVDSTGQSCILSPHGVISGTLIANLIYDMTKPGDYQVVVGLPFADYPNYKSHHIAHSKILKVRVQGLVVADDTSINNPN